MLGRALARKRGWIIVPTVLVFALSLAAVNVVTPRYKSEAQILIDNRENAFLRPNGERDLERTSLDAEAVTSQVQLVMSAISRATSSRRTSSPSGRSSTRCCAASRR